MNVLLVCVLLSLYVWSLPHVNAVFKCWPTSVWSVVFMFCFPAVAWPGIHIFVITGVEYVVILPYMDSVLSAQMSVWHWCYSCYACIIFASDVFRALNCWHCIELCVNVLSNIRFWRSNSTLFISCTHFQGCSYLYVLLFGLFVIIFIVFRMFL
jgi:hypothetical protein